MHHYISKPTAGYHHGWNGCGYHYTRFDKEAGRLEFREEINYLIYELDSGYKLSKNGEIQHLTTAQLDNLIGKEIPGADRDQNIEDRVRKAELKFVRFRSSIDDRRHAVKDLVDVLEYIRPQIKEILTKEDDADLFNIANNFGIRHHNQKQKNNYDQDVWLSWMFHFYLASIHACFHLLTRKENIAKNR